MTEAISESCRRRNPVQVAPDPGELAVRVAVGAVADVLPGQARHEGAELQEPGGRILQGPEARAEVLDDLQSSLHQAVALLEASGPARSNTNKGNKRKLASPGHNGRSKASKKHETQLA